MISYELAKALEDAGFPQSGSGTRVAPPDVLVARRHDFVYVPTLEELIEACGRPLFIESNIGRIGDETQEIWISGKARGMGQKFATGLTPTEAIARLWLALNKQ